MKDLYELLEIRTPLFKNQDVMISKLENQQHDIINSEDLFHINFHALEGSGIFDTILNIGKRIISSLGPLSKTISDVGKVVNSSSEVYQAIKDFKKPKREPASLPSIKPQKKPTTAKITTEENLEETN